MSRVTHISRLCTSIYVFMWREKKELWEGVKNACMFREMGKSFLFWKDAVKVWILFLKVASFLLKFSISTNFFWLYETEFFTCPYLFILKLKKLEARNTSHELITRFTSTLYLHTFFSFPECFFFQFLLVHFLGTHSYEEMSKLSVIRIMLQSNCIFLAQSSWRH